MMNIKSPLLVCVAVLIATASADTSVGQTKPTSSSGWSQIRGDSGKGVAAAIAKPPIKIDLEKQTAWETEIPGIGWSSPVYQDNLIWMTTSIANESNFEQSRSIVILDQSFTIFCCELSTNRQSLIR